MKKSISLFDTDCRINTESWTHESKNERIDEQTERIDRHLQTDQDVGILTYICPCMSISI